MTQVLNHPAASTDFLSRRHDGELPPEEAAEFEAHLRECAECRAAVADYEQALSAYRAAPTLPVAADLSARILRKLRAQTPSRRPFGIVFGIDLRWAGAIIAALLVVIIASPVFTRRSVPVQTEGRAPIPAYVLDAEDLPKDAAAPAAPEAKLAKRAAGEGERADKSTKTDRFAAAPPSVVAQEQAAATREEANGKLAAGESVELDAELAAPPSAAGQRANAAPAKEKAKESALRSRRQTAAGAPGGEGGAGGDAVAAAPDIHLTLRAIDGQGSAPDLASAPADARLAPLRGKEFLFVVESGGRVRSVEPRPDLFQRKAAADSASEAEDPALQDARKALSEIVFQPGDRSRRLLVRVE